MILSNSGAMHYSLIFPILLLFFKKSAIHILVKSPIIVCSGGDHTTQLFLDSAAKSIAEGRKEQDNGSTIRALYEPRP